jgi:hypothetical protein
MPLPFHLGATHSPFTQIRSPLQSVSVPLWAHFDHDTTAPAGPHDPARPRRLAWAALLKRAWRIDARACPRCGGEMALSAVIVDPAVAEKIIAHLGLTPRAPPPRRCTTDPDSLDARLVD